MKKILLDVDPGHDDALAIIMAGKHPDISLEGITVVAGNQSLDKTLKNTLNVCSYLDIDVDITGGMEGPILRDKIVAKGVFGESGLDGVNFREGKIKSKNIHSVNYIIKKLLASEEKITMVATGPLSNLAIAIKLCPSIVGKIEKLVMMGGTRGRGNITRKAEFNIFADPEAAYIVFESDIEIVMIGLNVTEKVCVTETIMEKLGHIDTRASRLFYDMMDFYRRNQKNRLGIDNPPLHDPTTIAYLIDGDIFKFREMNVDIILDRGDNYGETRCSENVEAGKKLIKVGESIDLDRFWKLVFYTLELYN